METLKICDVTKLASLVVCLACLISADASDSNNRLKITTRMNLKFPELVAYDGYHSETHTITTKDHYILKLFRIPMAEKCQKDNEKPPILFVHGLYLSGDDCIIPGPGNAHCYIYADHCYDVWVANTRGNRYSRNHTTLNPDSDPKFWDFDLDDFAKFDLPSIIDFILDLTQKPQLAYVGHAQGFAMMLVLCSEKPEYNDKVKVGFGISPTAELDHSTFIVVAIEGAVAPALSKASDAGLNAEFLPHDGFIAKTVRKICTATPFSYRLCSNIYFALFGYNGFQLTEEVLSVAAGHGPAGTSLKAFARWGQIKNIGFKHYNYGPFKNLKEYGTITPSLYELEKVTAKVVLIASYGDNLADVEDAKWLLQKLPNADSCILPTKRFGHLDFIYGKDLKTLVTPTILNFMDTNEVTCVRTIKTSFR